MRERERERERESINNSLRARSIRKTYQPTFYHLGECATYQPALDQSDGPIQTVIVQMITYWCPFLSTAF